MFLNHPSRKAPSLDAVRTEVEWLSKVGQGVFAGVEGAPGHQNATPLGAYGSALQPIDRWDPAIAPNGAVWDQLLAGGSPISGALATSDFHGDGQRRLLAVPVLGDLDLRARSHRDRECSARSTPARSSASTATSPGTFSCWCRAEGLPRAAIPGERVHVPSGRTLTVEAARGRAGDGLARPAESARRRRDPGHHQQRDVGAGVRPARGRHAHSTSSSCRLAGWRSARAAVE